MTYRNSILAVIMYLFNMGLQAQNSLHGIISEMKSHEALPGATVYIPDLKKSATADHNGKYQIGDLPPGKFLIITSYIGFETQSKTVAIDGETILDFQLSSTIIEAREVVITGVSHATEIRDAPISIISINRKALNEVGSPNIIDAITRTPGISQIATGPGISKPIIRGLGYNRVITLNDGIRQEGQQWGDEHGIEIDEQGIDKVEIIKGPASLMYGSDGLGGVISFLSVAPLPEGKMDGRVSANYQSNQKLFAYSAMQRGNMSGINWLASVSCKIAQDYRNKADGFVYNSGYDELNLNGQLGLNRKWGYSHLLISSFNQKVNLPEGERDSASGRFIKRAIVNGTPTVVFPSPTSSLNFPIHETPYQSINHLRLVLDNNFYLKKSRLNLLVGYQNNLRREFGDFLFPNKAGLEMKLQSSTYQLKYILPDKNNLQISLGFGGMVQNNGNLGEEWLIPDYSLTDIGTYLFANKKKDRWSFNGGIRYDIRWLKSIALYLDSAGRISNASTIGSIQKFASQNLTFGNSSGSLGTTYHFSETLFAKANISRGFRAPNIAELSSNGRHEGAFRYEVGNPNLKAETSLQGDFGLVYNNTHFSFETSLFGNQIHNYIFIKKILSVGGTDSIADPSAPVPVFSFAQNNVILAGAEISFDLHPHPWDWLHFENSFCFVNTRADTKQDSSKYLPFIPPARINSELRVILPKKGKHLKNSYALVDVEHTFSQNRVFLAYGTETPTAGYTLLNAGFGFELMNKKGTTLLNLILSGRNLANTIYQSHLSRLKYAPEITPRALQAFSTWDEIFR